LLEFKIYVSRQRKFASQYNSSDKAEKEYILMVENKLSIFQRSEIEWMEVKGDEFILSRKRTKLEIE
jgi:hypothetical protein